MEKVEEVQDAAPLPPEGRGRMFHSAALTSALSLSGRVRRLTISFGQTCQHSPLRRPQSCRIAAAHLLPVPTGRASRRERVCHYVSLSVVAVPVNTKHTTPPPHHPPH